PAYWLPRQASTGDDVLTSIIVGHSGAASKFARTATRPRPPMQIRAISTPASMPPRASTTASAITVPPSVRVIATPRRAALSTRRATSRSLSALTLGASAGCPAVSGMGLDEGIVRLIAGFDSEGDARVLVVERAPHRARRSRAREQRAHRLPRVDRGAGHRHVAALRVVRAEIGKRQRYGERRGREQHLLARAPARLAR